MKIEISRGAAMIREVLNNGTMIGTQYSNTVLRMTMLYRGQTVIVETDTVEDAMSLHCDLFSIHVAASMPYAERVPKLFVDWESVSTLPALPDWSKLI